MACAAQRARFNVDAYAHLALSDRQVVSLASMWDAWAAACAVLRSRLVAAAAPLRKLASVDRLPTVFLQAVTALARGDVSEAVAARSGLAAGAAWAQGLVGASLDATREAGSAVDALAIALAADAAFFARFQYAVLGSWRGLNAEQSARLRTVKLSGIALSTDNFRICQLASSEARALSCWNGL